jgi:hypothetical protein
MKIIKKTADKLIISNLRDISTKRKHSLYTLISTLIMMVITFCLLPFSNIQTKIILLIFSLILIVPGILLIRINTSEADSFIIKKSQDQFTHKKLNLLNNTIYITQYSLKIITHISIKQASSNSETQHYQINLHLKHKKIITINNILTPKTAQKIAKAISGHLNIPIKD